MSPPWYLWDGHSVPAPLVLPGIGPGDYRPSFPLDPLPSPIAPFDPYILLRHVLEEGLILPYLRDPRAGDLEGRANTKHVFHCDLRELSQSLKSVKGMLLDSFRRFWKVDVVSSIPLDDDAKLVTYLEPWGFGIQAFANTCWYMYLRAKISFKLRIVREWTTQNMFGPMSSTQAHCKFNGQPIGFKFLRLTLLYILGFQGFREMTVQGPQGPPYRILTPRRQQRSGEILFAERITDVRIEAIEILANRGVTLGWARRNRRPPPRGVGDNIPPEAEWGMFPE